MTTPDARDPIAAAESLEGTMNNLANEMKGLREYGQRTRRIAWGLAASLLLDIVLSVSLGIVAIQADRASDKATEATSQAAVNKRNALITCEATNEGRRLTTQLWTYVLDLSSRNPNQTERQKQQIAQFRAYIARTYAVRDCNNPSATVPTRPTATPTR